MPKVIIYSTKTCPFCIAAKEFFKKNKIKYKNYDVNTNKKAAEEMIKKSGQQGVPVIFVDEEMVLGFNEGKLTELLKTDETKIKTKKYDLAIIGSGIVGIASSMYAGRFNLKTAVIGESVGGLIKMADRVENYPGFGNISGTDLVKKMKEHAGDYKENVHFIEGKIKKIKKYFQLLGDKFKIISKAIIFATGSRWKELRVPGERKFSGKGVHYCGLCDGTLYKNKIVAVIGGGDGAVNEAMLLTRYAKKVFLIVRKDKLKAEPANKKIIQKNKKIEIIYNANVLEILGGAKVNSIKIDRNYKGKNKISLDAIFISIGQTPRSELAKELKIKLNKSGGIKINRYSETNIPGVFAAGDVTDSEFKQAITGVGEGIHATQKTYEYITQN